MFQFGEALSAALDSVEGKSATEIKNKKQRVLSKWLGLPQKFRSPGKVGPTKQVEQVEQEFTVKGEGS